MKIAVMQPYFFPYIGYFQLMNAVSEFVLYDNIEYTKKGWINRNRILVNGKDSFITVPIQNGPDHLDVRDRCLAATWNLDRKKLINKIKETYRRAPQFDSVYPMIESCIFFEDRNLFNFIFNSLAVIKQYLHIKCSLLVSSNIEIDHKLKAEKKIFEICKKRNADVYINPVGGVALYDPNDFSSHGIDLKFLKSNEIKYFQFSNDFVPWLSIIDVLMFNQRETVIGFLSMYKTSP